MARSGGVMSIPYPDFVNGTTADADQVDANNADIVAEITNSIAADGQTTPTADLPMGGYNHTGLGTATAAGDSVSLGQVQAGAYSLGGTAGGTKNALTLSPSPAITAYANGQRFVGKIGGTSSDSTVTLAVSGLATKDVFIDGSACSATKFLVANKFYEFSYDGAQFNATRLSADLQNFGNVNGPGSSTDSAVAQFDGATGKLLKDGPSIGTSANNLVQLDGSAKLPAVDGSQLINLPSSGKIVQVVTFQDGAVATGTTVTPYDDTIPQNTEGTEFITLSITPTSAANKLLIQGMVNYSSSVAAQMTIALHQDATVNAIAASQDIADGGGNAQQAQITHIMTAGTTSSTTFKIRIGANTAGTVTFNGRSSGRIFGGVMASNITILEIEV